LDRNEEFRWQRAMLNAATRSVGEGAHHLVQTPSDKEFYILGDEFDELEIVHEVCDKC